jgi:8-oxo-dGTP pyrophosphatase MutT (NUDIX family)
VAVGLASTATRCAPPTRSATDVAAPTRSLRLSTAPSMRTASPRSAPPATAAGFNEASSTSERLPAGARHTWRVDEIRRIASREVYRNDWMTVREDQVRRPDGSDGIYGVVDKPWYALIIAYDGDRLRLVEQFRYPLGMRRWEFPQGTAPGRADLDPRELAHRELREETGLRAESMVPIGLLDVAAGMSSQRGRVFVATGITEGDHEREHTEQDMHSEWFARSDVERMMRDGEITDAQSLAAWTLFLLSER